jgi:formate--tetrahydrofolate ligase
MDGVPRQAGFDITAASEVMVILSLSTSLRDLRKRLGCIVVGYTYAGPAGHRRGPQGLPEPWRSCCETRSSPTCCRRWRTRRPLIHAGPFGNIATGNSSVVADLLGIRTADFLLTEAGFGADMGAERFFDVKCRASGLRPDAAVLVVTVRALKAHSGRYQVVAGRGLPPEMLEENPQDVRLGGPNLQRHIEIVRRFGVSPVVAINAFPSDYESEHEVIRQIATQAGARVAVTRHVADGGKGALELADLVVEAAQEPTSFSYLYDLDLPLVEKIEKVAREIYGADGVDLAPSVAKQLKRFEVLGYGEFPVVIAKTHLSLSSDPTLLGARPAGGCRCARSGPPSAPATSTPSAARCGRCPGYRSTRPPSGSTSTRTATS